MKPQTYIYKQTTANNIPIIQMAEGTIITTSQVDNDVTHSESYDNVSIVDMVTNTRSSSF